MEYQPPARPTHPTKRGRVYRLSGPNSSTLPRWRTRKRACHSSAIAEEARLLPREVGFAVVGALPDWSPPSTNSTKTWVGFPYQQRMVVRKASRRQAAGRQTPGSLASVTKPVSAYTLLPVAPRS